MSLRYKGGRISATPPTTSGSAAVGVWTLKQQFQASSGSGWPGGPPTPTVDYLVIAGGGGGGGNIGGGGGAEGLEQQLLFLLLPDQQSL